ncbi:MAG: hypothetical protein ACR2QH_06890 [Geminicoccaceae bacterium]
MKYVLTILAGLLLAGCEIFDADSGLALLDTVTEAAGDVDDATIGAAAKSLDRYCEYGPRSVREWLREGIADASEDGNRLVAECAKDAE